MPLFSYTFPVDSHICLSPNDYFLNIKITEARNLLLGYSGLQIKEIALHLGFEDPYYFSRLFKKHTGFPPGKYRKKFEGY